MAKAFPNRLYVTSPMVTLPVLKVTITVLLLPTVTVPLSVAERLPLPAEGEVCVIVSVKVSLKDPVPLPPKVKLPSDVNVGAFRVFAAVLKVSVANPLVATFELLEPNVPEVE